ncbi:hypothetical protein BFJ69_g15703 [Fusarium oxysporum]|uniref:Uncharacterized protein n=1 Tax=Fusarium oxysporum TaxID=5507 RepID=A0A420MF20_FUSOX|nr:hypothetical protein BFJ69_g15703 [Fusarium oxysporum]
MQKNKRRGNGGHSFRAGPYDRRQNESGGRGRGRGRGRGVVRGRRGRGGYSSYQSGGHGYGGQRFGSDYGGRGGYTPYAAGGRGRGFGRGRGAGAGGPNFYEGPGRAADPEFRRYRQWDAEDGYGYQEYDDCQQWGQQVDEEDGYGYHGNEQEAPSYGSPAQWNSEAGGKQENVAGRIGYTGKGMIWGTSVDGSDQSMVTLNRMLPLASKDIWAAVHGRKRTLSQEELSKVEVDLWPQKKGQSTQIHGWNQTVQGSGSGSISGPVNKDSKGGTQPSATQGTMNADPIQYFLGFFKGHLSDDEGR